MSYSRTDRSGWNWIDENGLMLNGSKDYGTGDCIRRSFLSYYCYRDFRLVDAVSRLWSWSGGKVTGKRHPDNNTPMSRDHYIYSVCIFKTGNLPKHLYELSKIQTRISPGAIMTPSLRGWVKYLAGRSKNLFWFYFFGIAAALIYRPLHWIGRRYFGPEVDQNEWSPVYLQHQPKFWQWYSKRIMLPTYAVHLLGWQLKMVPESAAKRILCRLYRPMIGETNYVNRILFGEHPYMVYETNKEAIDNYKPMKNGRWSGNLNKRNDRDLKVLDPTPEHNNYDRDLLHVLIGEIYN